MTCLTRTAVWMTDEMIAWREGARETSLSFKSRKQLFEENLS